MRWLISIELCFLFLTGCASHPVINPHLPEPGKSKKGYALSVENVAPYVWYRRGVSDKVKLVFALGCQFMVPVSIIVASFLIKKINGI